MREHGPWYLPDYDNCKDLYCILCGHVVEDCCCPRCPLCRMVGEPKCYTQHKLIASSGSKKIRNICELALEVGAEINPVDDVIDRISRRIYKDTDCGAWVAYAKGGPWYTRSDAGDNGQDRSVIQIGSIVEGTDACTEVEVLRFPFRKTDFWTAVMRVETSAVGIWLASQEQET